MNQNLVKFPLVAWLPIRRKLHHSWEFEDDVDALSDFKDNARSSLSRLNPSLGLTSVIEETPPNNIIQAVCRNNEWFIDSIIDQFCYFVKVDLTCEIDLLTLNHGDEKNRDMLAWSCAGAEAASDIAFLLQLMALAAPGRLAALTGVLSVGDLIFYPIKIPTSSGGRHLDKDRNELWPKLTRIPLLSVSLWEQQLGICSKGFGTTAVAKAFVSFTHMVNCDLGANEIRLFWAMQGLEALYCSGSGDLRRQLRDKIGIFLGDLPVGKNIIGNLYDFRSKFVHGDAIFARSGFGSELNENDVHDESKMGETASFAYRLLIASLQKCSSENRTDLKFESVLVD